MGLLAVFLSIVYLFSRASGTPIQYPGPEQGSCNTVDEGYQCFPRTSHLWGQYSPYFSLEEHSTFPLDVPEDCQITFVQALSRHGARYPTASKSEKYAALIAEIQSNVTSFAGKYAFLKSYNYSLGSDDLTAFGEQQMEDSGVKFYHRYSSLTRTVIPFIRASGSDRVVASGEKFIQGYQSAKQHDPQAKPGHEAPVINVVIPESENFNNTLDHSVCTTFEDSELGDTVEAEFTAIFAPSIRQRLEKGLPGVQLSTDDVISLMDLCSFDTVAATGDGTELSPFCDWFTRKEWTQYDYLQSLGKYYGYGAGNPLGPAQGIGFANELIARLTQLPVQDHTSTNHTLDETRATFPLNATLYADFSHDNSMISAFFALGLYNGTKPLSKTSVESITETDGYSAAWSVPFGARAYVEMMQCRAQKEPLVRVLVNDRVVPLHGCAADRLGRCKRDEFIQGLSFARSGGNWGQCFV
ncbi:hypothetical protein FE257_012283 [Aspergillus nanangensis]|uniref:Phytase A n=1 Tax=Aspergillus nanangensis TaxID=2582783 RepID=A0AAD4CHL8_ASPNN|nr:hypothetical protein FE257_012283 [Aspergillus nanangensis]